MKRLLRWAFRLLILLIVLAVAGFLLIDPIAKEIIEYQVKQRTGLEAKIGKVNIGVFTSRIVLENVVVFNRPEFGGSPLLEAPELFVEYDRHALMSRQLHCSLVRLNLSRFDVIEAKDGRLNLDVISKQNSKAGGVSVSTNKSTNGYQFLGIDTLNLTLAGKAHFTSLRSPSLDGVLTADIREQVLNDVKSWSALDGVWTRLFMHSEATPQPTRQYWLDRLGLLKSPVLKFLVGSNGDRSKDREAPVQR